METYAKDNHFKLIMKTAFISLTLTFFNAQTSIYFLGFLVEGDTWFPRSCYRTTQSKNKAKQLYVCYFVLTYLTLIRSSKMLTTASKEFYAHNSQV